MINFQNSLIKVQISIVERLNSRANGVKIAPGYVFFLICNAILRFYRAAVGINKEIFVSLYCLTV